jgi:hypothetical protein
MNPSRFHLTEVCEELGKQSIRATHESSGAGEELGVGKVLERELPSRHDTSGVRVRDHVRKLHSPFRSSRMPLSRAIELVNATRVVAAASTPESGVQRRECAYFAAIA